MNSIKDYILQSHLQPGDPLPTESQLCETLGMSRSSVREAVRTLAALDIVEVRHGHGMFVGQVSMRPMVESLVFRGLLKPGDDYRSLREVVQVRRTLDTALAQAVVEAWQGREDPAIDDVVDQMEALAEQGETFTDQDRSFHRMLLEPVPNQLFAHLMEAFWAVHTLTVPMLDAPRPEDIVNTAKAHRAMLQAARSGDVEAYREAVVAHYEPLANALTRS
ncbi:MAG: FadR family transcriptional regulator [Actinomyces ruminicola]|nr:FadR family transcriptional regulator [Actinomyces ruminicola]